MKVFICWSGDRGLKFASACGNWITAVVGSQLQPALSVDIEKGGLWEIAAATAKTEVELAASTTPTPSLMALHYALRPLRKAVAADPLAAPVEVNGALSDINEFIKARDADGGGQIRRLLTEIEALVHRPPAVTVG
jgi:hypothetical protein